MKKQNLLISLCMSLLLAAFLFSSVTVSSASIMPEYVPGEVIVGFEETAGAAVAEAVGQLGGRITREISAINAVVVKVQGNEDAFIQAITKIPGITYAERNGVYHATFTPNDSYWSYQWNMPMIKAPQAWDTYRGWNEVVIAIIDTGVDYTHDDLTANYQSGGYDWVNNDFNPMDDNSHGTHCAGIAAAVLNNALGVAGVAQCKIWAEKVLNSAGSGSWDDLASGMIHATDKGVNVISMSLGGYGYSSLVESACNYAWNRGVLLVAAAGNDNTNIDTYPFYPASLSTVIAVSATTSSDLRWSDSNYGNTIEVSAPGASVYSTVLSDSYGYKTGTSMACPHVAGLAALIWSYKPQLTTSQVRSALQSAVDDKGTPGKDIYYGYGRINCQKIISSPETYQYRFQISGFADRVWVNVNSQPGGMLINGKVNVTSPHVNYPAPVLGWGVGNSFYMTFDFRKSATSFDLGFLVGTISTASGNLYRTMDGVTWVGPTAVTLIPFATEATEEQLSMAEAVEPTAIQYVEGFNPTGTVAGYGYGGGWYAIRYTPTVSYPLKKVELMAGGATGPFFIQLRPDSGGYPSSTVLRRVTFTMSSTVSWQGAEFDVAYQVSAGTPYWIVFQPLPGSRASVATSGTLYTHAWDNFGDGTGDWDYKGAGFPWMARFYREVQPAFTYHFTISPFIDKVYVNVNSQPGGMLINGLANVTTNILNYPAPVLGWGVGNSFYMPLDYRTVIGSGGYELGFIVGTISTASGKLYRTQDGVMWVGPTAVTLVPFAEPSEKTKLSATP